MMMQPSRNIPTLSPYLVQDIPGLTGMVVRQMAEKGTAPELALPMLIGVISLLTQGLADVVGYDNLLRPIGSNVLIIDDPCSGSNMTYRMLMKPIFDSLDECAADDPQMARTLAFFINDTSRRAMLESLDVFPVAGHFTDNGGGLARLLKTEEMQGCFASLLGGMPVHNAKLKSGRTTIPIPRIVCLWLMKHPVFDKLRPHLGIGRGGVCLHSHFQISVVPPLQPWLSNVASLMSADSMAEYTRRVRNFLACTTKIVGRRMEGRLQLFLSPAASDFIRDLEYEVRRSVGYLHANPSAQEYLARFVERVMRLAGTLHVFEERKGLIDLDLMEVAEAISRWHYRVFEYLTTEPPVLSRAQTLAEKLRAQCSAYGMTNFPLKTVMASAINFGMTKVELNKALAELGRRGLIQIVEWPKRVVYVDLSMLFNPYFQFPVSPPPVSPPPSSLPPFQGWRGS